ncbi:MAG: GntR family transcriptional regulator [Lachnospiraceae bacterium]|nr:GntR family transcriptional regulator [Lachnospiraceae bacterium]
MQQFKLDMDEFLPLRDVVFKTLRRAILTGQLPPGERLMEVHLSNQLGVSRTPVREAIRKLELEGLVTMVPRKGAQVAQITEKSLKDVLEVRRALDVFIAELACARITSEGLEELKKAAGAFEEATGTGDTATMARADVEFHNIIMESTGNERLHQLVNNLAEQMYRYRFVYLTDPANHKRLVEEHRMIYEAILSRNRTAAASAARLHIDHQEEAVIEHIRLENAGADA